MRRALRWTAGFLALIAFCFFAVPALDDAFGNWWLFAFMVVALPISWWLEARQPPRYLRVSGRKPDGTP